MTETVETVIARAISPGNPDEVTFASGGTGDVPQVVHQRLWQSMLPEARNAIAALDAAGYVVVPKEPTEAMTVEGGLALERSMFEECDPLVFDGAAKCYRAMLAAARDPSP